MKKWKRKKNIVNFILTPVFKAYDNYFQNKKIKQLRSGNLPTLPTILEEEFPCLSYAVIFISWPSGKTYNDLLKELFIKCIILICASYVNRRASYANPCALTSEYDMH